MRDLIEKRANELEGEMFHFLSSIVSINSFTSNSEGLIQVAEKITETGDKYGLRLDKYPLEEKDASAWHLCYEGLDQKPYYGLIGHFDTVHSPESSFTAYEDRGERVYGPGIIDMKGGITTLLFSLIILKELRGGKELPIKAIMNCDEEIGSPHSCRIIEEKLKDAAGAFVFEGRNQDDYAIVTTRKGIIMVSAKTSGKAAHAGDAPEDGINAVVEMAHKIVKLNELTDFDTGVIVTTGKVEGGIVANQIPAKCRAEIDIRCPDEKHIQRLRQEVAQIMKTCYVEGSRTEFSMKTARPPFEKSVDSEKLKKRYFSACREFGLPENETSSGGGSDANTTAAMGVASLDGLGPAGKNSHTTDEYLVKSTLLPSVKAAVLFLNELLESA